MVQRRRARDSARRTQQAQQIEADIAAKIQIVDTTQYATATRVRGEFAHMYYGAGLGSNGASSVPRILPRW